MWQDESDNRLINMLLQTVALSLAAAPGAGYWITCWKARQPVVERLREE